MFEDSEFFFGGLRERFQSLLPPARLAEILVFWKSMRYIGWGFGGKIYILEKTEKMFLKFWKKLKKCWKKKPESITLWINFREISGKK